MTGTPATGAGGGGSEGRPPSTPPPHGVLRKAWEVLTAPRGNRLWSAVVRGTGVAGLAGLLLIFLIPAAGPLVGLGVYTIWIGGPLSPFFPVGLEPMLVLFGRVYPPMLVAGVSTTAALYIEFLNYHVYAKLLAHRRARSFRESGTVEFLRRLFGRAPWLTIWFCAWAPLPFWVVRILAAMTGYPIRRYLTATLLGRYPKFWFFAALGLHWTIPEEILLGIIAVTTAAAVALWLWRRRGGRRPRPGPELMTAARRE